MLKARAPTPNIKYHHCGTARSWQPLTKRYSILKESCVSRVIGGIGLETECKRAFGYVRRMYSSSCGCLECPRIYQAANQMSLIPEPMPCMLLRLGTERHPSLCSEKPGLPKRPTQSLQNLIFRLCPPTTPTSLHSIQTTGFSWLQLVSKDQVQSFRWRLSLLRRQLDLAAKSTLALSNARRLTR